MTVLRMHRPEHSDAEQILISQPLGSMFICSST